jgi:hypothetical protein
MSGLIPADYALFLAEAHGCSSRNLWRMRQFYQAYSNGEKLS